MLYLYFKLDRGFHEAKASPVFDDVPKAKEGEADEETERSSNVRNHRDK